MNPKFNEAARIYMGECLSAKSLASAQARAALLGGELRVTPKGYHLQVGGRVALFWQWYQIIRILDDLEGGTK